MEQQVGRVGTNISLFGGQFVNTFAVQAMEIRRDNFGSFPAWYDGERVKGEYRGVLSREQASSPRRRCRLGTQWSHQQWKSRPS